MWRSVFSHFLTKSVATMIYHALILICVLKAFSIEHENNYIIIVAMFLTILNEVLKRNDKQCLKHQWKFENIPRSSNWEKHLQNTAGLVFMRETHCLVCHEV